MQVTYSYYRFPIVETLECFQITYDQKSFSEGYTKIVADIKPSFTALLDFLRSRGLIVGDDIPCSHLPLGGIEYRARTWNGERYFKALVEFCSTHLNFQLSARAYSFLDAFGGGNTSCTDKAMKKIRKQLREQYSKSDVLRDFTAYLQQRGLLS